MDEKTKKTPLINKYDKLQEDLNNKKDNLKNYHNQSKTSCKNGIYFTKKGVLFAFFAFVLSNLLFIEIGDFIKHVKETLPEDAFAIAFFSSFLWLMLGLGFNLFLDMEENRKRLKIFSSDVHLITLFVFPFYLSIFIFILMLIINPKIIKIKNIISYKGIEKEDILIDEFKNDISKLNKEIINLELEIKECKKSLEYLNSKNCIHKELRNSILHLLQSEYANKDLIEHHIKTKNTNKIVNV